MSEELDAAKLGNRNNRSDKERIRTIRKQAREIDAITKEMEPEDEDNVRTPQPVKAEGDIDADEAPVIVGSVVAIKAEGDEWLLDVLGVPFGGHNNGRDSDGEYFSAKTKLYLDRYTPIPLYYHGFDENGKPHGEPQWLGKTTGHTLKQDGVWFRVILDKTSAYAKRVWDAALRGFAKASSGSIAHLVRKERNGHITHWPAVELSIFDTDGKRQPANQYAVALPVIKSHYDLAGLQMPAIEIDPSPEQPEAVSHRTDRTSVELTTAAKTDLPGTQTVTINHEVSKMTEDQIQQMIADRMAAAFKAQQDAEQAKADRKKEVEDAVAVAVAAVKAEAEAAVAAVKNDAATGRRLDTPGDGAPYQTKFSNIAKYDGMEPADMSVLYGILDAAKRQGRSSGPSEDLRKAMAVSIVEAPDQDGKLRTIKAQMNQDFGGKVALKANELNQSTLANYGDEWVGVTYSTQLWERIVLPTTIVGRIPTLTVPQGSESIIIPLESTPPTFYKVAQASAQDANPGRVTPTVITSKMGTAKQTLTVGKLGAAVNYTGELEEDSMIPWASELRRSMTTEAQEVLEHIIIDGDTATGATTNINDIGGTPAGNEPFLLFDGFRKLALVTNTGNSRSGGALDITDFLETVKLLGLAGRNAMDKSKVSLIVGSWVNWAMLNLPQLSTQDVYAQPTIQTGRLTGIYGYEVLSTPNMHRANQDATYGYKANTSGKVDLDTAANNTTDSILAVRWDQWRLGWKRRMTFEIQRDAISDSTAIVVMMRVGMVYRDTEAASISYGITGI